MEPNKNKDHKAVRQNAADEREMAWGAGLRARYDEAAQEPLPDRFRELLAQIEDAESRER